MVPQPPPEMHSCGCSGLLVVSFVLMSGSALFAAIAWWFNRATLADNMRVVSGLSASNKINERVLAEMRRYREVLDAEKKHEGHP